MFCQRTIGLIDWTSLDHHTDAEIDSHLNRRGRRSGTGCSFTATIVGRIRRIYGLRSRRDRLRDAGVLSLSEIVQTLNVSPRTIKIWRDLGLLSPMPTMTRKSVSMSPSTTMPRARAGAGSYPSDDGSRSSYRTAPMRCNMPRSPSAVESGMRSPPAQCPCA